ncbi:MAG: hypothetical protein IPM21_05660 [Acidobacteria bacterium]|nr:hypothetical protein [Acidobacteriota bacterium]
MKRFTTTTITLITAIIFGAAITVPAQTPDSRTAVTTVTMPANSNAGQIDGNLKTGKVIPLTWAERSSVACFPGTRFEMFNGNHVFYRIAMPAASRITLTLVPKDGAAINLYALRQGAAETAAPPSITSAISCEAKYPIYANLASGRRVTNKDDGTRKIEFISVGSPYSILIGVAGANKLAEGAFSLGIKIEGR